MNCWYLENVNMIACIAMFFDTNSMNVIRFVVEALFGKKHLTKIMYICRFVPTANPRQI